MALKYSHTLLLVDDEASILRALQRLFRREGYRILTAGSGDQALSVLQAEEEPVSLIISDQRMPGMNGARFLEASMAFCPDAVRFLLTGYSDLDAVATAVNKGNIQRYLTKPWNDDDIRTQVRQALDQVELRRENIRLTELTRRQNAELAELNRQLETKVNERTWALKYQNKKLHSLNASLEKGLMGVIQLLLSLVASTHPGLAAYMRETARLARAIAEAAGLEAATRNRVEMAGLVHDIGLLATERQVLEKGERAMTAAEFAAYSQHPAIAALSLSSMEGLKDIGDIVLNHHENMDGSGYPEGRSADAIPPGARILAVAADYCTILHLWPGEIKGLMQTARRYLPPEVMQAVEIDDDDATRRLIAEKIILEGSGLRYDPAIVGHFIRCTGSPSAQDVVRYLSPDRLEAGMVLMKDLRLSDGRLLLTRGTALSPGALDSIRSFDDRDLLAGSVAVSLPQPEDNTAEGNP